MVTNEKIPAWLAAYLKPDQRAEIAAAVRQVEVTTNGEIVPMVVKRSIATGHVFPLATLALWALFFGANGPEFLIGHFLVNDEGQMPVTAWAVILPALALLGCVGYALSLLPPVQRWLTASADVERAVLQRAEVEFLEAGLQKTADATGILLLVSVVERRAVVLADRTIAEKLPPDTWQDVVALMLAGLKKGDLGLGFKDAIAKCGELVRPHFPLKGDDRNELSDALRIRE